MPPALGGARLVRLRRYPGRAARFAREIVDPLQFRFPTDSDLRKPDVDMANALVDSLAAEWDSAKHTGQYRKNLTRICG